MNFQEVIKTILIGIVEGITEWLPISSTGHMILLNELLTLKVSDSFWEMFEVVIQLGAILAVIFLYFNRLNPFKSSKSPSEKSATWTLWFKVVVAVIPSAVLGFLLDDWMDAHLYNYITVAVMLVVYGILFIIVEKYRKNTSARICDTSGISYKTAFLVGCFQMLSLIPGTSRSGATILGAILLGLSRTAAAEFSFFMAIPTMLGASVLKTAKFIFEGNVATSSELIILAVGLITAFLVSVLTIRFLTDFVKKHTFIPFGIYRILLGLAVIIYFVTKNF